MGSKLTYDTGTGVCTGHQAKHVATKGVAASAGVLLNPDMSGVTKALNRYEVTGALGPPDTRVIALRSDADRLPLERPVVLAEIQSTHDALMAVLTVSFDFGIGNGDTQTVGANPETSLNALGIDVLQSRSVITTRLPLQIPTDDLCTPFPSLVAAKIGDWCDAVAGVRANLEIETIGLTEDALTAVSLGSPGSTTATELEEVRTRNDAR